MYLEDDAPLNKTEFFRLTPEECKKKMKQIFAERFKELRLEKKYTQSRLASILHVSRSCLCTWEHGIRMPELDLFCKIFTLFDIVPEYLLGATNRKNEFIRSNDLLYCNKATYLDVTKLDSSSLYQLVSFYNDLLRNQEKENLKKEA